MEQLSLFSLDGKIKAAVENLRCFERKALSMHPDGYYLAFSGGKDSQVIYHLAKMSGVRFRAHYHITTVDPPELVRFIRKAYPDVVMDRPETSMWKLIVEKGFPPTRNTRYCCDHLKERYGQGCFVITGVRWAESRKRAERGLAEISGSRKPKMVLLNNDNDESRRTIENCQVRGKLVLNPIISWTEEDVWSFIHQYVHQYCALYDCGFSRLGCIGCPMASTRSRLMELKRYPGYEKAYLRAFERMLKKRLEKQKETQWKTAEDVYRWWLFPEKKPEQQIDGQLALDLQEEMEETNGRPEENSSDL